MLFGGVAHVHCAKKNLESVSYPLLFFIFLITHALKFLTRKKMFCCSFLPVSGNNLKADWSALCCEEQTLKSEAAEDEQKISVMCVCVCVCVNQTTVTVFKRLQLWVTLICGNTTEPWGAHTHIHTIIIMIIIVSKESCWGSLCEDVVWFCIPVELYSRRCDPQ